METVFNKDSISDRAIRYKEDDFEKSPELISYLKSLPRDKVEKERLRLLNLNNLAGVLREDANFSDKEIFELDLVAASLDDSQNYLEEAIDNFLEYPNLPVLLKVVNQAADQKNKYSILSIGEFIIMAEDCGISKDTIKSMELGSIPFFAHNIIDELSGASKLKDPSDITLEGLSDIEEAEEKDRDSFDFKSETKSQENNVVFAPEELALPPIAAPFVKESCGKPKCPAYKAEPTKSNGFSFLTPALAAEAARVEYKDYKLSKDALSNHTTKVGVIERNLGTYHARAARMQAVQEVENGRK